MSDWHERNLRRRQQRKDNRHAWLAGHRLRRQAVAFPGKGEDKFIRCGGGAFDNLRTFDADKYREWAAGTSGEDISR